MPLHDDVELLMQSVDREIGPEVHAAVDNVMTFLDEILFIEDGWLLPRGYMMDIGGDGAEHFLFPVSDLDVTNEEQKRQFIRDVTSGFLDELSAHVAAADPRRAVRFRFELGLPL